MKKGDFESIRIHEKNINSRVFVVASELSGNDDRVFHTLHRFGKNTRNSLVQLAGPLVQMQDTDIWEFFSSDERIVITLR